MSTMSGKRAAEVIRLFPAALIQAVETEQPIAMMDMEADVKQRIHYSGLRSNGKSIGRYSTRQMYVSLKAARKKYGSQIPTSKLTGRGKNARGNKFANGNPRRSMYFRSGYAGFRALMGRPIDKVDLKLTGNMSRSFTTGTTKNVSVLGFTSSKQAEIATGHEEQYGSPIFEPSEAEVDALLDALEQAAKRAADELLS